MRATPQVPRIAFRLAVAVGMAASLMGCAQTPIDADRTSVVAPPAIAAQAAANAQLSLIHGQAGHGLHLEAGAAVPPTASHGAYHRAYLRWKAGEVRALPESGQGAGGQ